MKTNANKLSIEDRTLDKIILDEDRKRVYYEVLNLQSSYKGIIILFYYCNLSLKDIASITGISQGAARTLLFRARKKLTADCKIKCNKLKKIEP